MCLLCMKLCIVLMYKDPVKLTGWELSYHTAVAGGCSTHISVPYVGGKSHLQNFPSLPLTSTTVDLYGLYFCFLPASFVFLLLVFHTPVFCPGCIQLLSAPRQPACQSRAARPSSLAPCSSSTSQKVALGCSQMSY